MPEVKECPVCGESGHLWCSESPPTPEPFEPGSPEDRLLKAIFGQLGSTPDEKEKLVF